MIGKLLGIDHGLRRVGVAVSDALGISARELTIIESGDTDETYRAVQQLIREQQAAAVVIGLPSNEDSTEQAEVVQKWADGLRNAVNVPVLLWDEQLSSADAKQLARQQKRRPTAPIDDLAARVILQSYLNALADGLAPPPSAG